MKKINRPLLSKNLRIAMATKDVNIHELANKSGVSKHQIDNVLYKRACTDETLDKLCKVLDISKDTITSSAPLDLNYYDFDVNTYNILTGYINIFTKNHSIKIDKHQMEGIIHTVYNRHFNNKQEAINAIMSYLLDQGELKKQS